MVDSLLQLPAYLHHNLALEIKPLGADRIRNSWASDATHQLLATHPLTNSLCEGLQMRFTITANIVCTACKYPKVIFHPQFIGLGRGVKGIGLQQPFSPAW